MARRSSSAKAASAPPPAWRSWRSTTRGSRGATARWRPSARASRAFYVDTLGLQVTEETADIIYLRGLEERNHHSLVLKKADIAVAEVVGFRVFHDDDLDKAK